MAGTNLGTAWIQIKPSMRGMTSSIRSELSGIGGNEGASMGSKFSNAFAAKVGMVSAVTERVFSGAISTISNQISDAVYRADTLNRFPKVMEMMGYSADDAAKSVEKLREGVKGIPTSLADVVSGTQQLASITGDVNKASDWTLAVSDAMLIMTGDVNEASRGMHQFMQILSSGRVTGNDWNTIMEVASPIMNELARSLGYTSAAMGGDFYTALQKGTLSIDDMMAALVKLDKEGGNGLESLHERVKTSTGGIEATITNLKQSISLALVDIIQSIGAENIQSIISAIKQGILVILDVLKNLFMFAKDNWSWLQYVAGAIAVFFAGATVVKGILKIKNAIGGLHTAITGIFGKASQTTLAKSAESTFSGIGTGIKNALTTIKDILTGVVQAIMEPVKELFKGIGEALASFFTALANPQIAIGAAMFAAAAAAIAAAIFLIGSAIGAVMPALTELFNNIIMPIAQFIADTVLNLINVLTQSIVILTNEALIPLGEFMLNTFVTILQTVTDTVTRLTQGAIVPLINTLSGALIGVLRAVGDVLTNVVKAALEGVASVVRATGDGFREMGRGIQMALDGVRGVLHEFVDLIKSVAAAAVAIVALVKDRSIVYGNGYARISGYSLGGRVIGNGSTTSDSIPAMLSNGEYVIKASTAQEVGYDALDKLNQTGTVGDKMVNYFTINGYNKSPEELAEIISRKIAFSQKGVIG